MKDIFFKYFKYIVLICLLLVPVFGYLDTLPIRIWDEARQAINAYEMLNNHDYIVTHFNGSPDMWNTKPPLLIWLQVGAMKLFGVNELAVRLPSAISAFLTCMILLVLSKYYLKSFWFGFIVILVLITSNGYINFHATRTGDYDALLTLFTTLSGLFFFAYCETQRQKQLYGFFIFTALAVLTKSVTGLLFLPAILIYSFIEKQFIPLLKNKHFYFGLFSFLTLVVGYYLLREVHNPGYLNAVQENELGGRYLKVVEKHQHGFWFYYNNIANYRLSAWYFLVPFGLVTGLFSKNKKIKKITLFSFLMVLTFFLIISTAQTKLEWYDTPLYPFLSIIIGVFIYYIFQLLKNNNWLKKKLAFNVVPFVFLVLVFISPYQKIFEKTYKPQEYPWHKEFYEIGYYLKDAIKGEYNLDGKYLLFDGYKAHNRFYLNILNDKGVKISFKNWKELDKGNVVITSQNNVKEYVEQHYKHEVLSEKGIVKTYKIHGRK